MNYTIAETADKLDDKKYWLELFEEDILVDKSEAEKQRYMELLEEHLKNRTQEQIELDEELEILSSLVLDSNEQDENFLDSVAFNNQLEKIKGLKIVKAAECVKALPEGSSNTNSSILSESSNSVNPTSSTPTTTGIHFISSDYSPPVVYTTFASGVKSGHGAHISYPAWELGGVVINALVWSTTSNANEEYRSVSVISLKSGKFELVSEVCLNDKGSMTSVNFEQVSNSYVISSINTILFTSYDVKDRTFFWHHPINYCFIEKDIVENIFALSTGNQLSGLRDVVVS